MRKSLAVIFFVGVSLLVTSCQREMTPESALRGYVEYRFGEGQSISELLSRTTGPLHERLQEMSEEEFQNFLEMREYRLRRFRVERTSCQDEQKCHLTYLLRYDQFNDNIKTFSVEVRKIAEIVAEGNTWKIADVKDVKTFFDSKEPIEP